VSIELAFEAFESHSQYRTQSPPLKEDLFSLSFADYGWKAGAWRLLSLLDEFDISAHVLVSGLAAERYPEVVAAIARAGHEIAAHGWVNDRLMTELDAENQLKVIRRCTMAVEQASGQRPVGWTSPALMRTADTFELLCTEGYLWCGDDASEDLPFVYDARQGQLVVIPRGSAFQNDLSMWVAPRNAPGVIWEGFKDNFDVLYAEGKSGFPNKTELTLHCQFAGRPTLIPTVRRCLAYAKEHDGVWFATRREIAEWTLQLHKR
jgi:peptidoglycan/xylan/chitin deacetylase (PgdA/CDA1 family)